MPLLNRVKILAPFWLVSLCYFTIPFIRDPIPPPAFFVNMDAAIPFVWWMIIPYYLYYISIILPLLVMDVHRLKILNKVAVILLLVAYSIFIIWPISCESILMTRTPNPLSFMHGMVTFPWLYQNAFPSVHVIIGTFIGGIMGREYPQKKWLFWLGAGLIFFATFLTKQHFIMDAIFGLILGLIGLYLWDKQTRRVA